MSQVEVHHGAASDIGLVRAVNEDSYLSTPPVFVVADGMGGHQGGDVASRIVIEEFERLAAEGYDPRHGADAIAATLQGSQRRIEEYAAGALEQVSVDHSVVQELVDAGSITPEQAATHPARNVITRALGGADFSDADYFLLSLPEVERLLLCSDGVTGMIDDAQIAEILGREGDAQGAADRLVAAAVEAGGRDNATAVVVDVESVEEDADGAADRPADRDNGAAQEGP